MDNELRDRIETVISRKIQPYLQSHNGGITVTDYTDGILTVKLLGQCTRCAAIHDTLDSFIKTELMEAIEEIRDVVLDESAPEDMLAFAKKILNHSL